MGTSQSNDKCGCFGSQKGCFTKEHRIRSCVTEVTMENMEREINRVMARQRIAKQKGYLKYKGSKVQKTSDNQSCQRDCQHYSNQQHHLPVLSSDASSLDDTDTVCAIFSRMLGVDAMNQAEVNKVSSHGSSVDIAEQKAVTVTDILDQVVAKAVDIAEQEKAVAVADILDQAVAKAVDIAEQQKAVTVTDILDQAVAKAIDIAEQQKAVTVTDILDQAVAKAVDIAEQQKAVTVTDILDQAVAKAVNIAEQQKEVTVAEILDQAVAKVVDIAEQQKVVAVSDILDQAVAKAVNIAEHQKAVVAAQLNQADECRPLDPVNVPSPSTTVVAHDKLLKLAEQEDEMSVKAEPLMVPSMSCKGSWIRDSSSQTISETKQNSIIRTESKALLYKPRQLKEVFKQTKTPEGNKYLQQKVSMSPFRDPLRKELYSGKFTILDSRDHSGCAIAVFIAQGNSPAISHEVVMNNIYIQLNQAVKSPQTQANGVILLYDFSKAHYKASDLQLFAKILKIFKTAYPVPLKRTLLVSAPFWLKAELQLLGLRVRHEDRIEIVTRSKLKLYLPVTCLDEDLGGNCHDDHVRWVEQCLAGYVETFGSDESVPLGDVAFELEKDVEEIVSREDHPSAPPVVIWQAYPKKSGHGSSEDTQSGLKSIPKRKVQENRDRRLAPQNLIWQTSNGKSGQASLRAVHLESKSESKRKEEENKGNLMWPLNHRKQFKK